MEYTYEEGTPVYLDMLAGLLKGIVVAIEDDTLTPILKAPSLRIKITTRTNPTYKAGEIVTYRANSPFIMPRDAVKISRRKYGTWIIRR